MTYGTLHIKWPNGQTRDFPLIQPSIFAGRAPDNELVLEDASISRRQARLSIEAGRLTVEDLGSANGTFIGDQRLVANVSSIVPTGQPIRLGDLEIRFTPPASPVEQATVVLPAGAVPIQVEQATVILPAGAVPTPVEQALPFQGFLMKLQPIRSRRDFQLIMDNQGHAPVNYHLSAGDDALADPGQALDFFFPQEAVSLQPGQQQVISLSVSPKLKPKIGARETRNFTVTATPLDPDGVEVETAGQLLIQPPLPLWIIPLGLVLCLLCACLGLASAYAVCPTAGLPFCSTKPVIKVFTATPPEAVKGESVIVAWEVTGAQTVEFTSPVEKVVETSGLQTFNPEVSTVFTLRATNAAGSVEQSLVVTLKGEPPVIESFTANPGAIIGGQTDKVVLSWTVIGADSVSIPNVSAQTFDPKTGNVEIPAPTSTITYTLVAANQFGTVQQELQITVTSAGCVVSNVSDHLNLRAGPSVFYPIVEQLPIGAPVEPIGRNGTGDWLKVTAAGKEGWVSSDFITCSAAFNVFPTVDPASIPPPPPTFTPAPTSAPSPTAPPLPTSAPVFNGNGFITYHVQSGGHTTLYLQGKTGAPIPLLADKDDAEILDFTPNNGGRFAIWAMEAGVEKVYIVGLNGGLLGGPLNPGWVVVTDGDWSIDGQQLVIEAVTSGKPAYYYFDANGKLTGQPTFP